MKWFFEKSLLMRMGVAMATITTFAFLSMLSSVIITETMQGAAGAINQAGSLRMQSYRIASSLARRSDVDDRVSATITHDLMKEFEARLKSPRLTTMLPKNPNEELRHAYTRIEQQWLIKIRPMLNAYVETVVLNPRLGPVSTPGQMEQIDAAHDVIRQRYLSTVDAFVNDIDLLVRLLEDDAEANIQMLHLIQVVSLFLTLSVVFVTMFMMHTDVLVPLRDLLTCAQAARRGDFSVRTSHQSEDELGQLGSAFNVMAEDLSKIYADLEQRVRQKTADLERSNRSLELLYNTTRFLNESPLADATYTQLLRNIETLIGIGPGTICLSGNNRQHALKLASTRRPKPGVPDLCNPPNCARCFGDGNTHIITVPCSETEQFKVISIPITDQNQQHGVLLMEIPCDVHLQDWQRRLLEAVADHIGIAINMAQRASQGRRLALLEERSVIARELHDSLAQALSYMKIQVSRLDALIPDDGRQEAVRAIVQELRDGLNSAYRELRELLTTFRLRMDGRGLSAALEETVHDFRERSTVTIDLTNRLHATQLTPNEEIHILQLVREALANVVRHAKADHAQVHLDYDVDGRIVITIEDNGVGIPEEAERRHHYGLAIMSERADSLGGTFTVSRRKEGGTCVRVAFTPQHRILTTPMTQQEGAI